MTAPTLSFVYHLVTNPLVTLWDTPLLLTGEQDGLNSSEGWFEVAVNNGITNTVLISTAANTADWMYTWFDLSPWISQTITVTFNLHQVTDSPYLQVYLDEVSVGSAYPDLWMETAGLPRSALPGDQIVYRLVYGNRGGAAAASVLISATLPAGLSFVSASLPPTVTGSTLTWAVGDLAAKSGLFEIVVTATVDADVSFGGELAQALRIDTATKELETANNTRQESFPVGYLITLPVIQKTYFFFDW